MPHYQQGCLASFLKVKAFLKASDKILLLCSTKLLAKVAKYAALDSTGLCFRLDHCINNIGRPEEAMKNYYSHMLEALECV